MTAKQLDLKYQHLRDLIDVPPSEAIGIVARYYGYDYAGITSPEDRTRRVFDARKTAMYVLHRHCGVSFRDAGEVFGVTGGVALQSYRDLLDTPDPNAQGEIDDVVSLLRTSAAIRYDAEIPF